MAYDEALAATLRAALADRAGLREQKMFGGLAFLVDGHMVCGTYRDRGMFRVGKPNEAEALALPRVRPMEMPGGRRMPGMVEAEAAAVRDPELRARLTGLALGFVDGLPPKERHT